jgi:hypothetical protein
MGAGKNAAGEHSRRNRTFRLPTPSNRRYCAKIQAMKFKSPWTENQMLWTIFVVLLVLWVLGLVTSYTMGGFIHILLVLALVTFLIRMIQGQRVIS